MLSKEFIGYVSILVVILVTIPYLRQVIGGKIKPHIFTFFIWTLTTGITAAARLSEGAGPGMWAQWAGALSCLSVTVLAWRHGERHITRSDWVAFFVALAAIPLWQMTDSALLAVAIGTGIDLLAYYPTFRKSWHRPHEEAIFNYAAANFVHLLSLLATVQYNLTNVLFQGAVFMANSALILMLLWRRRALRLAANPSVP